MSFRRINFFRGLFMTADDWKTEQNYHIEKRRLHSRALHTPGIVTGEDEELRESLKVSVLDTGAVVVQPGYALDARGRDLRLLELKELPAPSPTGDAEKELYIYIAFEEEKVEPRESRLNPDNRDDAIILERTRIDWTEQEPDNNEKIELARIKWRPGRRITREHIDTGHVRYAGARQAGGHGIRVKHGEIELNANPARTGLVFAADDPKVLIEAFTRQEDAIGATYLANVCPNLDQEAGDARIFWRIESSVVNPIKGGPKQIAYYLLLTNFGTQAVKVQYTVYRLNAKPPT